MRQREPAWSIALQGDVANYLPALDPDVTRDILVEEGHAERVAQHRTQTADELHFAQRAPAARVQFVGEHGCDEVGDLSHVPARVERLRPVTGISPAQNKGRHGAPNACCRD